MSTNITTSIVPHRYEPTVHTDTNEVDLIPSLCDDVLKEIFKKAMEELPVLALVCKQWKNAADDEGFYKFFRGSIDPKFVCSMAEWNADNKGIEVDIHAIEPLLPRRAYRDQERSEGIAYLIAKKIEVVVENQNLEVINFHNIVQANQDIDNAYHVLKESNTPYKLIMSELFWKFKSMQTIFEEVGKSFLG